MIDLIMDFLLDLFEKISAAGNEGSRSQRRDNVMIAAVLAAVLLGLCAYCLIRGWQSNDAEYLVFGFLCLVLTVCEIIRLIQRCRKR